MPRESFLFLLVFTFTSATAFGGVAFPFDSSRCGIEFPKVPADLRAPPTGSFTGTSPAGIRLTYWPLLCKTGAGLEIINSFSFGSLTGDSVPGTGVQVRFKRAAVAAGQRGTTLKSGECAWVDRPLDPNEPTTLFEFYKTKVPSLQVLTKRNDAGKVESTVTVTNTEYDILSEIAGVMVFYVTRVTPTSPVLQTVPFCQALGARVTGKPFYQIR